MEEVTAPAWESYRHRHLSRRRHGPYVHRFKQAGRTLRSSTDGGMSKQDSQRRGSPCDSPYASQGCEQGARNLFREPRGMRGTVPAISTCIASQRLNGLYSRDRVLVSFVWAQRISDIAPGPGAILRTGEKPACIHSSRRGGPWSTRTGHVPLVVG